MTKLKHFAAPPRDFVDLIQAAIADMGQLPCGKSLHSAAEVDRMLGAAHRHCERARAILAFEDRDAEDLEDARCCAMMAVVDLDRAHHAIRKGMFSNTRDERFRRSFDPFDSVPLHNALAALLALERVACEQDRGTSIRSLELVLGLLEAEAIQREGADLCPASQALEDAEEDAA